MNKRILVSALSLSALTLLGCRPPEQNQVNSQVNYSISEFQTRSGVECIVYDRANRAGVSCNWGKYNKLIEKCEQDHLSKYPSFPDIKGRCEKVIKL
jgi:hypothetical protein